jgi:hypothetical protein
MADYSFALPQLQFYKAPDWAAADEKAAKLQAANALLQEKQRAAGSANALRSSGGGRARTAAAEADPTEVRVGALDAAYAPFTRLVNRVQSPEDVAAFTAAVYNHPILGGEATKIKPVEQAVQDSQKEFMADPDRWRMMHGNLDGKTIYQLSQAATAPKIEKVDLGGAIKFIDMNPKSATFKQEMGDFTKMPVPRAALDQTSSVMEPPVNNLMPAPATAAAGARAAGPVQLAMLGGGNIPLLQMTRPMPSEGGVTTPTKVAARKKSAPVEEEVTTEDGEPPLPKLTPAQELKLRDQVAKDYEKATANIAGAGAVLDAAKKVREAKGLSGATGLQSYFPSVPDSDAAIAENRIANLRGKVTLMGKSAAAATGAIGSIANQEWKILRDMVAAIEPAKGKKALLEQIAEIEDQARGADARIRDAYEKHHEQNVKRFPVYKNLSGAKTPETDAKPDAVDSNNPLLK